MDAAAAISLAVEASTTLIAATSRPQASPTPDRHMLYYHGATVTGLGDGKNEDGGECKLLGSFSIIVQTALGLLALLSLVFKRWRERPQRPVKVWAFDASKQVFGSAMLHLANLFMSMFSAGQLEIRMDFKPNPCSFYLLNLGIDTTLGIPILIVALRILNLLASYTPLARPPESIESGNYGQPPRASWWFKQSMIYFLGLLNMKICVFFLIQAFPIIVKIGDWALRWTEGNTALQITFVMLLFPVIMNAIQYYIIDTFIKKKVAYDIFSDDENRDDATEEDPQRRRGLLDAIDEAYSSDSDSEDRPVKKSPVPLPQQKDAFQDSDLTLTEDHSPVPPYEPPSSGSSSSRREHAQSKTVE
ncbi:hypothetical protein N7478_000422 [Penicillium angulare]|uniref:uncharacterized protein n=1 Tax=Penicillium angulare TaxID=116970 RepID=UPI00254118C6|nr:uncharacterized protein N7478_000422 [Penicillium angulare]KAJ5291171.1 hypothetical protein N7478_000422 [Penicillium angulare]